MVVCSLRQKSRLEAARSSGCLAMAERINWENSRVTRTLADSRGGGLDFRCLFSNSWVSAPRKGRFPGQ